MAQKLVILGAGESGTGAAILAKQTGYQVFLSDQNPIKPAFLEKLEAAGIHYESGCHSMERILDADLIVKSPGIPEKSELMQAVRQKGIPVIGEIEFGYRYAGPCTIVSITGSNGKTTTTHLTYHILKWAGKNVREAGNIGLSFAEMVAGDIQSGADRDDSRVFVLETSSFQLDDIQSFRPNVALLLNITPDHLDRYGYQMENYIQAKFRITMNQRPGDLFITNADDPNIQNYLRENPDWVQCERAQVHAADIRGGYVRVSGLAFDLASCPLKGPHNYFNAATAILAALRLEVEPEIIAEAIYAFTPPPHRLELVAEINGVRYINDSKATNVDSVYYALQAMDRPTVWIVGGQDKGNNYAPLLPWVESAVKAIVCMGLDNSKIIAAFRHLNKPMFETRSAEEAVRVAASLAQPGEAVLLSPACASFDLFKNYEHRGEMFKKAVESLSFTE
jgi:UDP-N-acetylmuramoylalanine--D-glutamate ligase